MDTIPLINFESISEKYDRIVISEFLNSFQEKTGQSCDFAVKVPGRVNLIGDHVDYNGFPVISMAIEKYIMVLVHFRTNLKETSFNESNELHFEKVNLYNHHNEKYQSVSFQDDSMLKTMKEPMWYHYFLCGYKGQMQKLQDKLLNKDFNNNSNDSLCHHIRCTTLDVYVYGNIPPAAGLSSSSALVCASAISIAHTINLLIEKITKISGDYKQNNHKLRYNMDKKVMANDCANFERFIGTQGGGVDQAIAMLAEKGSVKLIEFYPELKATSIPFPNNILVAINQTRESYNKAATQNYNCRVFETRLAAAILNDELASCNRVKSSRCITLSEIMRAYEKSFEDMINLVHKILQIKSGWTLEMVMKRLKISSISQLAKLISMPEERIQRLLKTNDQVDNDSENEVQTFKLEERAQHVFEEAARVYEFQKIINEPHLINKEHLKMENIRKLINASHKSLDRLFECSTDQINFLIDFANKNEMTLGSRITGAGWGGCFVTLLPCENSKNYFPDIMKYTKCTIESKPEAGAYIISCKK